MIQGILFNSREESEAKLSTEAFQSMSEIRILLINSANFSDSDFLHLPASLKWLEWKGCPLQTLPLESKFKSLVVLNLSGSFISQLWGQTATGSHSRSTKELFDGLKVLDLSSCGCLNATPNFTMAPNLEKLILDECNMLNDVDDSIGSLKKLVFLSIRECVSLEKLPNEIYGLSSLVVFNLEGCSNLVVFPQFPPTNSTIGFSKLEQLILRDCQSLKVLPDLHKFPSLRILQIDGCQCLDHRRKHLFEDLTFGEWDELSISGSRTLSYEQEFSFLLPVGSINDPLLLQHLQCHGYGDPSENGTIKLHVRHEDMTNNEVILETAYEAYCDNPMYMDDVHDHCYTINFGRNDKINEVRRDKTIIMKVKPANNFELRNVDVKVQKRSKFRFINLSRRGFQNEPSIFYSLQEADKLHAIKYSTRMEKHIDELNTQLNVQCREQMLFFDWTIEEVIIFTLIFGNMDGSWNEQRYATWLPRQETGKVFDKIKVLDLSSCKFLEKTPDLARIPNLKELILDHCECLLEVSESIGQLENLILLSMVGCANLCALPCGILKLNSLQLLRLEGCSKINILPEAGTMEVRLENLQQLILDHCTSLTEIPDYVGGFKHLLCLSFKGCISLKQLPRSIESLVVLEELILDHCTLSREMLNDVGRIKCLRRLSLQGRSSLQSPRGSVTPLPVWLGILKCLINHWLGILMCLIILCLVISLIYLGQLSVPLLVCLGILIYLILKSVIFLRQLKSVPDLSNSTALEELKVTEWKLVKKLVKIPGLRKLSSLKILYVNDSEDLDLDSIGHLNNLSLLTLNRCIYVRELPDSVKRLTSLRVLRVHDCGNLRVIPQLPSGLNKISATNCPLLDSVSHLSNLTALEELNVAECEMLAEIPVLRWLSSLKVLYMNGCRHRDLDLIGHLNNLSCLTLKRCLHVQRLPDSVERLTSLRVLCVRDYGSLQFIPQLPSGLNKISATNCPLLDSVSDLSNLIALEELNVADCEMLAEIPGLRKLSSLKVLYMNGCRHLDLDSIRSDLQEAAFHGLEAFSISAGRSVGNSEVSFPFPRRGSTRSEPLQVQKINLKLQHYSFSCSLKIEVEEDGESNMIHVDAPVVDQNKFLYSADFRKDDEINRRLRVALSRDDASRIGSLRVSCPQLQEADIWFGQSPICNPEADQQ